MPISTLDPASVAGLTRNDLLEMALSEDREARRAAKAGRLEDAKKHDAESEALAVLYRAR